MNIFLVCFPINVGMTAVYLCRRGRNFRTWGGRGRGNRNRNRRNNNYHYNRKDKKGRKGGRKGRD